jgi:hypothetical protein
MNTLLRLSNFMVGEFSHCLVGMFNAFNSFYYFLSSLIQALSDLIHPAANRNVVKWPETQIATGMSIGVIKWKMDPRIPQSKKEP